MNTIGHVRTRRRRQQVVNKILMTIDARALSHSSVARFYLNRVIVSAHRERQRVKETVVGFGDPLADRVVRQMTIVANCDMVVTALLPRIQMVLHHVTIHASLRIVAQVTGSLAVPERKRTYTGQQAQRHCKRDRPFAEART